MCYYTIYTQGFHKELVEKINTVAEENGISSHCEMSEIYFDTNKLSCKLEGEREICDESLAQVLSDVMQKRAILYVCEHFLRKREELTEQDRKEITQAFVTNNYLSRQEGVSYVTYYLLYLPIYKEIKEKRGLNIEGWLQFRIEKYKILLRDVLEQFVEDYVAKKEVVSFIRLMREVSLLAVPLEEVIHIVYRKEGKIQIYNKNKQNVTGHYIKKYCKELLLDSTLTREDLILHVLITISPKELVIHGCENMKSKQFMNTIEIIFGEQMTHCHACSLCKED